LIWLFTRAQTKGLEKIPLSGAAVVVCNHLGDADFVLGIAYQPRLVDAITKVEMYDFPIVGKLLQAYGVIWIHRGQPDRHALRASLEGLKKGRVIGLAPEGRESLTGGLEEGTNGAAYLALKSGVPLVPVTFTGTENRVIYANMKHLRRTPVTLTVGEPFYLPVSGDRRADLANGTRIIMQKLASQLPPEYQGVYSLEMEASHGN